MNKPTNKFKLQLIALITWHLKYKMWSLDWLQRFEFLGTKTTKDR